MYWFAGPQRLRSFLTSSRLAQYNPAIGRRSRSYQEAITSPYRDRLEKGLPALDSAGGDFPWKQDWFPGKD